MYLNAHIKQEVKKGEGFLWNGVRAGDCTALYKGQKISSLPPFFLKYLSTIAWAFSSGSHSSLSATNYEYHKLLITKIRMLYHTRSDGKAKSKLEASTSEE